MSACAQTRAVPAPGLVNFSLGGGSVAFLDGSSRRAVFAGLVVSLIPVAACVSQQRPSTREVVNAARPFDSTVARAAVERLASQLEANFVYPDRGLAYAAILRAKLVSGAYASAPDDRSFAALVTADLQAVYPEGHLRLDAPSESAPPPPATASGNGPGTSGWLAPGVAYMRLHGFQGNRAQYDSLLARLRTILDGFADAKALIVDARPYAGGALDETDVMASYFFPKATPLLDFDIRESVEQRNGAFLHESARLVRVDGPPGIIRRRQIAQPIAAPTALKTAPIFILTSRETASGGEGFTFAMQRTGRATVIGEQTRGAGHFGPTASLGGGYRAMVPIGRPRDPVTDKGWELVGVTPDVKLSADAALTEALRRAGVDPATGRAALARLDGAQHP